VNPSGIPKKKKFINQSSNKYFKLNSLIILNKDRETKARFASRTLSADIKTNAAKLKSPTFIWITINYQYLN